MIELHKNILLRISIALENLNLVLWNHPLPNKSWGWTPKKPKTCSSYLVLGGRSTTVFLCILPALGFTTPWDFTRISIRICHFNPPWYLTRTWNLTRTITNNASKISGHTDWTPCFIRHSNGFHYCKQYTNLFITVAVNLWY